MFVSQNYNTQDPHSPLPTPLSALALFLVNISLSQPKLHHYPNNAILTFVNFAASDLILIPKQAVPLLPPLLSLKKTYI